MLIKPADDKSKDIERLARLLKHQKANKYIKDQINKQIRFCKARIAAKTDAAYYINFHYENSKNWAVIHDLRLEHNGQVAQIDHMLINRFLQCYIIETKSMSEKVEINEHGEFTSYYKDEAFGIPSPIEQNKRHILFLNRFMDSGIVNLPKRLGFQIKPDFYSFIVISPKSIIVLPERTFPELDQIVKTDQLLDEIAKQKNENSLKLVSAETVEAFAKELVKHHKPIQINYESKFGLDSKDAMPVHQTNRDIPTNTIETATQPKKREQPSNLKEVTQNTEQEPLKIKTEQTAKSNNKKYYCSDCTAEIEHAVARFCWFNKKRFGEKICCRDCQVKYK